MPIEPPGRRRGVQIGWGHALLTALMLLAFVVTLAVAGSTPFLLVVWFEHPSAALASAVLAGLAVGLCLLATLANSMSLRRLQPGTRGRARLLFLSASIMASVGGSYALLVVLSRSVRRAQIEPFLKVVMPQDLFAGVSDPWLLAYPLLVLLGLSCVLTLLGTIGAWFLVPLRVRRWVWRTVDALLLLYLTSAVATQLALDHRWLTPWIKFETALPIRLGAACAAFFALAALLGFIPPVRPTLRWAGRGALAVVACSAPFVLNFSVPAHASTLEIGATAAPLVALALLVLRLHARWLPIFGNGIERWGLLPLVATRHLRARKSDYLAIISVISIAAITTACAVLTVVLSVMGGFRNDLKEKIIGNNAHVVIDGDGESFGGWEAILTQAKADPEVVGATPFVSGEVMITSATNLAGAVLRGIDPESVSSVIDLQTNLTQGRLDYLREPKRLLNLPPEEMLGSLPLDIPWLDLDNKDLEPSGGRTGADVLPAHDNPRLGPGVPPADGGDADYALPPLVDLGDDALDPHPEVELKRGPNLDGLVSPPPPKELLPGIIVGRELARSLRLFLGDEVNVVSPFGSLGPQGPMPKSRPFRVAGIFYSGMYEYDMKYVYVTLPEGQRFLNVGNQVTGIELKTADIRYAPEVANRLRTQLAGGRELGTPGSPAAKLRVQDWRQLNRNLFGALELERLSMFILLGFAILTAGFCVFATITLMVQEKRPQVGILVAMGAKAKTIVSLFLLEGLFLGSLGAEFGLGWGYLACFYLEHFGLRMDSDVYYIDRLPVHLDGKEFALIALAAVIISVLSTVFPAVMASRLRPVDAIRFD